MKVIINRLKSNKPVINSKKSDQDELDFLLDNLDKIEKELEILFIELNKILN